MLTLEEQQHKDEIVSLTAKALDDNGIECDTKISKISEEQPMEILEQVRGSFEIKRRMRKIKIRKSSLTLPYNSR
jgi:ribosome maturation protein Sdo1